MNLLTDDWIPVRPQQAGAARQISLKTLFCGEEKWELALPRDDMELAALQLLICLAQVLLAPTNRKSWAERIAKPLPVEAFESKTLEYQDWFQLDHADHPFMQMKNVKKKSITPMDKLLTGLDTSENSRFVNEPGLADGICSGCASIALFNYASNSPSFGGGPGGGFKYGIRGTCAVSTFAQGQDLRTTVWINVLTEEFLNEHLENWKNGDLQRPTWVEHIVETSKIPSTNIGLLRGLFWQPGCLELSKPKKSGKCTCCGNHSDQLYDSFLKAPYGFSIDGFWEHPHSPQILTIKKTKNNQEERSFEYLRWPGSTPAWTQLSGYIVERSENVNRDTYKNHRPALVIKQLKTYLERKPGQIQLLVGGYRNFSAKIIERRHEYITLNSGWESHAEVIRELVDHALKYEDVLAKSLISFTDGDKDKKLKGAGLTYKKAKKTYITLEEIAKKQYYRRSENLIIEALANTEYDNTFAAYLELDKELKKICESIFAELTSPYEHDLELFRTLTIARRSLQTQMKEICINSPEKGAA